MKKLSLVAVAAVVVASVLNGVSTQASELDSPSSVKRSPLISSTNSHYADECTYSPALFLFDADQFPAAQAYVRVVGTKEWSSIPFKVAQDGDDSYRVEVMPGSRTVRPGARCAELEVKLVK